MYQLLVYYPGDEVADDRVQLTSAADVVAMIPKVLADHPGCERIVVMADVIRLFSVDCAGNRHP